MRRTIAVVAALVPYQNPDGGFGHGFEPDFRLDASSALCTTFALQTLTTVQVPHSSPMVREAIRYFQQSYDPVLSTWPLIPRHDNTAPRAPWWNSPDESPQSCNDFRVNPLAEILGYFFRYGESDAPEWLMPLVHVVIKYFEEQPVEKLHVMMELSCAHDTWLIRRICPRRNARRCFRRCCPSPTQHGAATYPGRMGELWPPAISDRCVAHLIVPARRRRCD